MLLGFGKTQRCVLPDVLARQSEPQVQAQLALWQAQKAEGHLRAQVPKVELRFQRKLAAGALGGANKGGAPAALGSAAGCRSTEGVVPLVDGCAGGGWGWQLKRWRSLEPITPAKRTSERCSKVAAHGWRGVGVYVYISTYVELRN